MRIHHSIFLSLFIFVACSSPEKKEQTVAKSQVQEIIDNAITFHGMEDLDNSSFSLTFRKMDYTYVNQEGRYEYTRTQTDSASRVIFDAMDNDGLVRLIDGDTADITEERRAAYTRSVNSVIYFFRLPFGLNDLAVNKTLMGEKEIKGKTYFEVKVTFGEEKGGEDFDDVFLYWFDKEDYSMDYLAYLYHTDGGGMRFREAINPRRVNGILIQDYVNLKPDDEGIDIMSLGDLYQGGELTVLSEINNEKVTFSKR
jgi:hypothetical protein